MLSMTLAATPPPAGEYLLPAPAQGTLVLEAKDAGLAFSLDVMGSHGHSCALAGTVVGDRGSPPADDCLVRFVAVPGGVDVSTDTPEACHQWCGARAWFPGRYRSPPPACVPSRVDAARASSGEHLKARRFGPARAQLEPLVDACRGWLAEEDAGWLRHELALALHGLGDEAGCRQVLEPLRQLATAVTLEDVSGGTEPALVEARLRLAQAARTTLAACAARPKK